jgi:hypothetical protein
LGASRADTQSILSRGPEVNKALNSYPFSRFAASIAK